MKRVNLGHDKAIGRPVTGAMMPWLGGSFDGITRRLPFTHAASDEPAWWACT